MVSLDPAHSISGILGIEPAPHLREVHKDLWVLELDAKREAEEYTQRVLRLMEELVAPQVIKALKKMAGYIASSPTALETASMHKLAQLLPHYSYVVLDFAPTGQLLRWVSSLTYLDEWFRFILTLASEKERVDRFMGRKADLVNALEERKKEVAFLLETLKSRGVLFAVANRDPLSLQEAETLLKEVQFLPVYVVINKVEGEVPRESLTVPYVEAPYGLEGLGKVRVEDILRIVAV